MRHQHKINMHNGERTNERTNRICYSTAIILLLALDSHFRELIKSNLTKPHLFVQFSMRTFLLPQHCFARLYNTIFRLSYCSRNSSVATAAGLDCAGHL